MAVSLTAVALLAACDAAEDSRAARWVAVTDTVGDTVVVRTMEGSIWGEPMTLVPELSIGALEGEDEYLLGSVESLAVASDGSIYLYDGQAKALRRYAADGTYLSTLGREGGGPGEYKQPDGGLAVLPDGRVLLRDPGNARINLYAPEGESLGSWPIRGGWFTSTPLFVDTAGRAYHWMSLNPEGAIEERRHGLLVLSPEGERLDSIAVPESGFEAATIRAAGERVRIINNVPFAATEEWTFSPLGYFVQGVSTRYAFDLHRPEGVLRIERAVDPVPVHPDERANEEERATFNMRQMVPDWRWNGPPIPDTKPAYGDLLAAKDGRIWVVVSLSGERIPADEMEDPHGAHDGSGGGRPMPPPRRWRTPAAYDVFEPDGRYLGRVHAPDDLSRYPTPVIEGDRVWAVRRDEMGVQYVVRYRVIPEGAEAGPERTEARGGE